MAPEEFLHGVIFRNAMARAVFCLAAAVAAAAVIDPVVERMANTGLFGHGRFTDNSNLDVIPALLAAVAFSGLFVAGVVRRTLRRAAYAPDWLHSYAPAGARALAKLLPAVFVIQLLVLWSMETLEQVVVSGAPLGGTIWLGGPVVVSLAMHALGCVALTCLLSRTLRWSAASIAAVVYSIQEFFSTVTVPRTSRRSRASEIPSRFLEPLLARLQGRAPPFLSA